ncbi:MAG: SIMPL domain-containing protein [Streptosporangiaceae bacterium]
MNESATMVVSVRGEARRTVPPDSALIAATIAVTSQSKAEALRSAAAALDSLTADLAELGGVALGVDTVRRPLTWSAQSAVTRDEHAHDKHTGQYEPTGKITATVAVQVTVRAVGLLDVIGSRLAGHGALAVREVSWQVDWDNAAWPQVRADAIHAAIAKGRDYAAALGGQLSAVEHVADTGLLSADGPQLAGSRSMAFASSGGGHAEAPSLDPVPQELTALIEARFTAVGISLARSFGQT